MGFIQQLELALDTLKGRLAFTGGKLFDEPTGHLAATGTQVY